MMHDVRPEPQQQQQPDSVNPPVGSRHCLWLWQLSKDWPVEGRTYSTMSELKQRQRDRFIKISSKMSPADVSADGCRQEGRCECVSGEWNDGMFIYSSDVVYSHSLHLFSCGSVLSLEIIQVQL